MVEVGCFFFDSLFNVGVDRLFDKHPFFVTLKDKLSKEFSVDVPIYQEHLFSVAIEDVFPCGRVGGDHLMGNIVGIDDGNAMFREDPGDG